MDNGKEMSLDSDPIVDFRVPINDTSPDHRAVCGLQSEHILQLKELSYLIKGEDEFVMEIVALLAVDDFHF